MNESRDPSEVRDPSDVPDPPEARDAHEPPAPRVDGPVWVLEDGSPVHIEPVRRPSLRRRAFLGLVALAVIVALALGMALTGPGPTPPPNGSSPNPRVAQGRIAMVASDGTLSIVDRTGAPVTRLLLDATVFRFPAFSPDGTSLAAIGATQTSSSVVVFDVRSGVDEVDRESPRTVYSSPDRGVIYASWAPDGRRLGFLTGGPGTLALRIGDIDDVGPARIVTEAQPLYWDWLDTSTVLVHGGGAGADGFVDELGIDGAPPVERVSLPGIFQSPAISADRRYVALVARMPSGVSTLVIDEREGLVRSALVEVLAASFAWSPVRNELAYIDGGGAAGPSLGPLRIGDAATGQTRTVLDAAVAAFFWSPDGAAIAALAIEPADGGNIAAVPGAVAAIPGFHVRLVIVDAASGERKLERIVALSDLFEQQLLPFFDQYAKSHPIWSADSREIVLPLVDTEGTAHLTVIPVDGGPEVDVGPGVLGFWSP